jgi:hypothetical protein
MIEIDRSKCKKMLVWDNDETECKALYVVAKIGNNYMCCLKFHENHFEKNGEFGIGYYENAKPLPEPKPMTALDTMWWAGTRKVFKWVDSNSSIRSLSNITTDYNVVKYKWNELIRENGETKLKYDEWKPFNFDECDMGEG